VGDITKYLLSTILIIALSFGFAIFTQLEFHFEIFHIIAALCIILGLRGLTHHAQNN